MKRSLLLVLLISFCLCASSEALVIPGSITGIEGGAFEDTHAFTSAVIPAEITFLADTAFPSHVRTIYGLTGSYAETYAARTGRGFVPIDIDISSLTVTPWAAPGTSFAVFSEASSPIWPLSYRYQFELDGEEIASTEWLSRPQCEFALAQSGEYDVRVFVRSEWTENSRLFPAALTIGGNVRFAGDPLRVYVGEISSLLAPEETRDVTIKVSNTSLLQVSGTSAKGLKSGTCLLTATAAQSEGLITTTVPVEVCIKVADILLGDVPRYIFPGDIFPIAARVVPVTASHPEITWTSSDENVLTIDEFGVVTAHNLGESIITANADGFEVTIPLRVSSPIAAIVIHPDDPEAVLYTSGTLNLAADILPATADQTAFFWSSADSRIASVNQNGVVLGVTAGQTTIYCDAMDGTGIRAEYPVTVLPGVSKVTLTSAKNTLFPGQTLEITASVTPWDAMGTHLTWTSSDEKIATVDETGLVTPVGSGVVTISAAAENGVRGAITLRVYDQNAPTAFVMGADAIYLNVGESYALTFTTEPVSAVKDAFWSTSNSSIVTVDENGQITAKASGTATITATSQVDASVSASRVITVLNPSRTLVMPARQTKTSAITTNLNKIAAVKNSAYEELNGLYAQKKITSSVMSARKTVISNAFSMYSFPWMTPSYQEYWKAENSEGGAKDFKPGIVYYGLPYISSGYYYQRLYNVSKAVSEKRYTKASSGNYYLLNQNNLYNGKYCGNDCSSMVAMSYFSSTSASTVGSWNTHQFYTTNSFVTLSKSAELYPGDIIVRDYRHVVIFLYYANSDHTQMVVIEQGGNEAGINTISTSVYSASSYFNNSYIPRRYASWQ